MRSDIKLVISTATYWPSSQVALSNRPGTIRPFDMMSFPRKSISIIQNPRFSFCSRRPAFAPIYGNQYSSQQSSWTNASSQFHSLAAGNNASTGSAQINKRGGSDGDTALANNVRKEKRQYKKRKHKNQRDKPPYPTPGNFRLISLGIFLLLLLLKR